MNATVEEWRTKAEGDYRTASREFEAVEAPNFDAVCFHAQQCAEKLMKGLLIQQGVVPPKTHDLMTLSRLLESVVRGWQWEPAELRSLTTAAVEGRYPGGSADREEAAEALQICADVRERLLTRFEDQV